MLQVHRPHPHVLHLHGGAPHAHLEVAGEPGGRHRAPQGGRRRGLPGPLRGVRQALERAGGPLRVRVEDRGRQPRPPQAVPPVRQRGGQFEYIIIIIVIILVYEYYYRYYYYYYYC